MKWSVSLFITVLFGFSSGVSLQAKDPKVALQTIIFPSIEFVEVPLHQVLDFLQVRSTELSGSSRGGVNFILQGDDELRSLPITLNLRGVSLGQALWFVGEVGRLKFTVDQHAVIVSAPSEWKRVPAPRGPSDQKVIEKVNRLSAPRVEFSDVPLKDAVDLLRSFASELDLTELDPAKKGINIVLLPGPGANEECGINLSLSQVPLSEAIRYTASLASYEILIENGAVLLSPKPPAN